MEENRTELTNAELESVSGGDGPNIPHASNREILARAEAELGKPYQWGAVGPDAYDCSGLVSYCLTGIHARLGTTTTFMSWPRVSDPQPGDICTSASHCGIYVGPGTMIHAPTFGQSVCYGAIQGDMIIVRK